MPSFTLSKQFKIFSSNLTEVLSVWIIKSERHQWKQHIKIRLNTIDFLDKVSIFQSKMGKVTITIDFTILEIVLVPQQIYHTKRITLLNCISQRRVLKLVLFLREVWLKKFLVPRLFLWLSQKICIRDHTAMVTLAKNNF